MALGAQEENSSNLLEHRAGNSVGYATDAKKPGGSYKFAPHFGWTLQELNAAPDVSLSDHAPITVDLPLTEPPQQTRSP